MFQSIIRTFYSSLHHNVGKKSFFHHIIQNIELLEYDPLVRSEAGNRKLLDLIIPFLKKSQIPFREIALFAITENHAKMCLANLAAMSQVCKGIKDYFAWLVESMDLKVDLTSYGGSSSQGNVPLLLPKPSQGLFGNS